MSSTTKTVNRQEDRFHWLVMQLVGQTVRVRVTDGRRYEGLLHNSEATASGFSVSLRHVREVGGSVRKPYMEQVNFPADGVAELAAVQAVWQQDRSVRHTRRAFNTDTGISGPSAAGRERELVSWCDDSLEDDDAGSSNSGSGGGKKFLDESLGDTGAGGWDQFKAASEQWGFKSTYHEELYTTKLDKGSRFYKEKVAEAERIAAEITAQQSANPHVAEERGQETEALKQMDDADRYTDVLRIDSLAAAEPPKEQARQQPDSKATIASAALKAGLRADAEDFNPFEAMTYRPPPASPPPASLPAAQPPHFAQYSSPPPASYHVPHFYGQPAPMLSFYGSSPPSIPTYPSHVMMHHVYPATAPQTTPSPGLSFPQH